MNSESYQQGTFELRPRVDPDAEGEVDLNLYPDPKEKPPKIFSKTEFINQLLGHESAELRPVKVFYFFFFAAFGSLFPLMGVYFKQMGLNPTQAGLLVGARPFVEFISTSFWSKYAQKKPNHGKTLLICSLVAWILFTLPVGFLRPPASNCVYKHNESYFGIKQIESYIKKKVEESKPDLSYGETLVARNVITSRSPIFVNYAANYNEKEHGDLVIPIFSSVAYKIEDIQKAFMLLFLLVVIGEFFSAPAISLVDTAVIALLGDNVNDYGHQRMFGSIGWGLSMFFTGIALDNSISFSNYPCEPQRLEKSYTICFCLFSILMGAAVVTALQIPFPSDLLFVKGSENGYSMENNKPEEEMDNQIALQLNLPALATPNNPNINSQKNKLESKDKTAVFAKTTNTEISNWAQIFMQLDFKCRVILFLAWFMGFGIGLIFTFLFWHLQDYGGSPTLFGVASIINHASEIISYFYSFKLISEIGHIKVLCLALIGNVIRFLIISIVENAWWVLPFELMQGITHATVWAALSSYMAHNTAPHLKGPSQGMLQCIHLGIGRGCGAIFGGLLCDVNGTGPTFRLYGYCSVFVVVGFILMNFYKKDHGFISDLPASEDPHQMADEASHLAPHGVPSNPLPKVLSSTNINDMDQIGLESTTYSSTLKPNFGYNQGYN